MPNYQNAFNCKNCPESNGANGCPMWWETIATNLATEQTKIVKGCGYAQLPTFLIEIIKAANRPAEELGKLANIMNGHMLQLCYAVKMITNPLLPVDQSDTNQKDLFDGVSSNGGDNRGQVGRSSKQSTEQGKHAGSN